MTIEEISDSCFVICPYCKFKHGDAFEFRSGRVYECLECEKSFKLEIQTDVTYTTTPKEQP